MCWATALGPNLNHPWALVRFNPRTGAAHAFVLGDKIPASSTGVSLLTTGLSCTVRGDCTALGLAGSSLPSYHGTVVRIADGAITDAAEIPDSYVLPSLSCPSPGECVAAGYARNATGTPEGLIAHLSGVRTTTETTVPGVGLESVACRTTSRCVAVGLSLTAGAIMRINVSSARVANVPASARLGGVTCPGWKLCWAESLTRPTDGHTWLTMVPFAP